MVTIRAPFRQSYRIANSQLFEGYIGYMTMDKDNKKSASMQGVNNAETMLRIKIGYIYTAKSLEDFLL